MLITEDRPVHSILTVADRNGTLEDKGRTLLAKVEDFIDHEGVNAAYTAIDGIFTLDFPYGASIHEVIEHANAKGDEIAKTLEQARTSPDFGRSLSHAKPENAR